ncbi:MAG: hypothetical protein ACFE89_13135 [Candidatus Hodarchaeota archaeon]
MWTLDKIEQGLHECDEVFQIWHPTALKFQQEFGNLYKRDNRMITKFHRRFLRTFPTAWDAYLWNLEQEGRLAGHKRRLAVIGQSFHLHIELADMIGFRKKAQFYKISPRLKSRLIAGMIAEFFELNIHILRPFVQHLWTYYDRKPKRKEIATAKLLLECLEKVAPEMKLIVRRLRREERNGVSHADFLVSDDGAKIEIFDRRKDPKSESSVLTIEEARKYVDDQFTIAYVFYSVWVMNLHKKLKNYLIQERSKITKFSKN